MKKNISRVLNKVEPLMENIATAMHTVVNHRDKKVIVIGAWMGEKFSDNSRFLYQYLFENKQRLGLKRVVWVTRNTEVNKLLNSLGYESYLIGTPESKYWHLKAGVHILCNMAFPQIHAKPDIDTKYSWGAVKFQLWHGVGMKSVGSASNEAKTNENSSGSFFHNSKVASWCTTGGWNEEYFLSTSQRNAEVNLAISKCKQDHLYISSYPRNCECLQLLPEEKTIIDEMKANKKVIGYFPTFRSDLSGYVHPLEDPDLLNYINNNNILWVEKKHSFDHNSGNGPKADNTLILNQNFDINVLYGLFDLVLSDYSSVVFDCAYKKIPVVMYCPDLEKFKKGDVGFLFDIETYCNSILTKTTVGCKEKIEQCYNGSFFSETVQNTYQTIRKDFFDDRDSDYLHIWKDMENIINLGK